MAIRVDTIEQVNNKGTETEVKCSLFADTKSEVTNSITGADVDGLDAGDKIAFGSSVMTASGDMAFRKSNGTWNWL